MCVCVHACVRACLRVCVIASEEEGELKLLLKPTSVRTHRHQQEHLGYVK